MGARCLLVVLVAVLAQGVEGSSTWRVGGSAGWELNVDFSVWTQGKVFEVGDILLFSYNKSSENVLEVSHPDYATCTTISPIAEYADGNSTVLLGNLTSRYFISGIPGHCVAGMNLQIRMGAPSPAPSPTPAPPTPTPSPAPLPSPITTSPISTPPPPPLLQTNPPSPSSPPSSAPPSFTVSSLAFLLSVAASIGAAFIS